MGGGGEGEKKKGLKNDENKIKILLFLRFTQKKMVLKNLEETDINEVWTHKNTINNKKKRQNSGGGLIFNLEHSRQTEHVNQCESDQSRVAAALHQHGADCGGGHDARAQNVEPKAKPAIGNEPPVPEVFRF
jgi:hypothetical protein